MNNYELFEKFSENSVIDFELAEQMARLALPLPRGSNEKALLKEMIYEAVQRYEPVPSEVKDTGNYYITRLNDILNDRGEMVRWRIKAGYYALAEDVALNQFSEKLQISETTAKIMRLRLGHIADYNLIEPPPLYNGAVNEGDEDFSEQEDIQYLDEEHSDPEPEFQMACACLNALDSNQKMHYNDVVVILRVFMDLQDERDVANAIENGLRFNDEKFMLQNSNDPECKTLEKNIQKRCRRIMRADDIKPGPEPLKWCLLAILDRCEDPDNSLYMDQFMESADYTPREAENLMWKLRLAAEKNLITDPYEQTTMDYFIQNHQISKQKPPFSDGPQPL